MRSRNIKPDFFLDDDLATLPFEGRILFAGLWCCADRAGRLEDRPSRIRASVFPYDAVDVDALLTGLVRTGQIIRYTVNGQKYIQINGFAKHQSPHHTEKASSIPCFNGELPVVSPLDDGGLTPKSCSNPPDSLIPDSLIPDSITPPTPLSGGGVSDRKRKAPKSDGGPFADIFPRFYDAYPRKRAVDDARKAWGQVVQTEADVEMLRRALPVAKAKWAAEGTDEKHIPYPASWLRSGDWKTLGLQPPPGGRRGRTIQDDENEAIYREIGVLPPLPGTEAVND